MRRLSGNSNASLRWKSNEMNQSIVVVRFQMHTQIEHVLIIMSVVDEAYEHKWHNAITLFLVVDIHMFASSKTVYECYTNTMDSSHFIFFKCYARCVGLSGDFAHSVYNVFWLTIEYHFLHLSQQHTNAKFNWHLNETFFTIQFQVHLTHNIWAPKQMCLSNRTSWFWYDGKIAHNAASINDYMYMKALLTKFVRSQLVICYWINRMKKHKGIQTKC